MQLVEVRSWAQAGEQAHDRLGLDLKQDDVDWNDMFQLYLEQED